MNEDDASTSSTDGPVVSLRRPRVGSSRWAALLIGILVGGLVVGWAAAAALLPPTEATEAPDFTFVEAVQGEVESVIELNGAAEWLRVPVGSNQANGVVTSVDVTPGQMVSGGTVLFTVGLRPVSIAAGNVPSFRPLMSNDSGQDVAQLQQLLADRGHYSGPIDGKFSAGTTAAVKTWQRSIGVVPDGVVQLSDVIFVPTLPARIFIDQEVLARGTAVSGGEPALSVLLAEPSFTLSVTASQAALAPVGTRVELQGPAGAEWQSEISAQTRRNLSYRCQRSPPCG